jgi:hypothetical protein
MNAGTVRARLRPIVAGRKLVLTGMPLAGLTQLCATVRSLEAERPFLLATGVGTGPLPAEQDAERFVVEVHARDMMDEVRRSMALLGDLPPDALAALDRWDPGRRALVLSPMFNELAEVAGRRVLGPRRPAWRALEDKVRVDALWDALGVRRAPSAVVAAEAGALREAAARLDRGAGTVWAGDAREGFNGGAEYLRWVRDAEAAAEAAAFLAAHCDQARVMPFLEGVPCGIHGFVLPGGVAAVRPVEQVTLRRPGRSRLLYAGVATFWDPPGADREAMRALARRVGAGLAEQVGYRGAFTVDGVLTGDGFLPTELNPRFGAGLATIARGVPELPLYLLQLALVAGEPFGIGAGELEALLVEAADGTRAGGAWTVTEASPVAQVEHGVVFEADACRFAQPAEAQAGTLSFGPSNVGGFLRLGLDPARVPAGPAVAPLGVAAFALADRLLGTGIGPLEAARPAR